MKHLCELISGIIMMIIILAWCVFVTTGSIISWHTYNNNKPHDPVLTFKHNRIHLDGVKTDYTLKEVSKGVLVLRKDPSCQSK